MPAVLLADGLGILQLALVHVETEMKRALERAAKEWKAAPVSRCVSRLETREEIQRHHCIASGSDEDFFARTLEIFAEQRDAARADTHKLLCAVEEIVSSPEYGVLPNECYPDSGPMTVTVGCEEWRSLSKLWERLTRAALAKTKGTR